MTAFIVESFEDLAQQCVMSDFKFRMLYVFVRVGALERVEGVEEFEDGAVMVQVLFDAHQPAAVGLDFNALCETADAQNPSWNMVVVGITANADASLPSEAQSQTVLAEMREKIMMGEIDGYALLDRNGLAVEASAEVVPITSKTGLN